MFYGQHYTSIANVYTEIYTGNDCVIGGLRAEMWYAVELCARSYVDEWGQEVLFRQEENGIVTKTGNHFALYRQEGFHLVV